MTSKVMMMRLSVTGGDAGWPCSADMKSGVWYSIAALFAVCVGRGHVVLSFTAEMEGQAAALMDSPMTRPHRRSGAQVTVVKSLTIPPTAS